MPHRRLDLWFLLLAAALLLTGVCMGIWMGLSRNFRFAPVHAHLNLLGWASLALFGLTHRAYPAFAATRLATAQFALSASGAVVFPVGMVLAFTGFTIAVALLGALLWLAGVVAFLAGLARLAFAPAPAAAAGPALRAAPAA